MKNFIVSILSFAILSNAGAVTCDETLDACNLALNATQEENRLLYEKIERLQEGQSKNPTWLTWALSGVVIGIVTGFVLGRQN